MTELEPLKMEAQCYCTSFQLADYISKSYPVGSFSLVREIIEKYLAQEGTIIEYTKLKHQVEEHEITALLGVFAHILLLMDKECLPKKFLVVI